MRRFRYCSSSLCVVGLTFVLVFWSSLGFDSLLELPRSGTAKTRLRTKRVLSVRDFGAKGDGISNDTQALINAWDTACSSPERTAVVVPADSSCLVHPIYLGGPCRSKVTLLIAGTIVAPTDPEAWYGLNTRKWLYIHNVNHLTIEGGGTIDGKGQKWWARSCKVNPANPCRHAPRALTFHKCNSLRVKDLTVVNSQQMHMAFTNCIRVSVSNIKLLAPSSSPNTDAIHISSSRGVQVTDSTFMTGDDCISLVGNSSEISIRNIVCGPGHGISIGSLGKGSSWSQVSDVTVDGASLSNTKNGVRIKTWQGGAGFVSRVTFQNMTMKNVNNPIIIDQYYCDSRRPCLNQTSAVKVENVSFIDIRGTSAKEEAIKFACSNSMPCEGLYLKDIRLLSSKGKRTRSFCWEAYGSISGVVYPPVIIFPRDGFIKKPGLSESYSLR
ncbi:hypothetical protein TIFTF001_019208 [Ficus carica]|uniref:endo-polygalacturonase n=1 Tax=Ficus carica TaxID=3494 RepID=A0AA88ACM3_FICCA|nr:hypothetical protein TIFTF001_019208 [Ficus carica]